MPDYEIRVAGPIGPAAAARLTGFTTTTLPPKTVLSGTVTGPDGLLRILDLLRAHGLTPIDIQIDPDRRPSIVRRRQSL